MSRRQSIINNNQLLLIHSVPISNFTDSIVCLQSPLCCFVCWPCSIAEFVDLHLSFDNNAK